MRIQWDDIWLKLAENLEQRSLCDPGAGAVVVAPDNRIAFPGYAGPPAATGTSLVTDCTAFCERHLKPLEDRDPGYGDCQSIHAEQNSLIHADRTLIKGGTFYVSRAPCWTCEKMIRNSGVVRYLYPGCEILLTEKGEWLTLALDICD